MVKIEVTPQSGVPRELLSLLAALPRDQLPLYLPWHGDLPRPRIRSCPGRFPGTVPQAGRKAVHWGQGRGRFGHSRASPGRKARGKFQVRIPRFPLGRWPGFPTEFLSPFQLVLLGAHLEPKGPGLTNQVPQGPGWLGPGNGGMGGPGFQEGAFGNSLPNFGPGVSPTQGGFSIGLGFNQLRFPCFGGPGVPGAPRWPPRAFGRGLIKKDFLLWFLGLKNPGKLPVFWRLVFGPVGWEARFQEFTWAKLGFPPSGIPRKRFWQIYWGPGC